MFLWKAYSSWIFGIYLANGRNYSKYILPKAECIFNMLYMSNSGLGHIYQSLEKYMMFLKHSANIYLFVCVVTWRTLDESHCVFQQKRVTSQASAVAHDTVI